jgi:subtilisin family serine protease
MQAVANTAAAVPGEILVKFRQDASPAQIRQIHARHGVTSSYQADRTKIERLKLPAALPVETAVARYRAQSEVEYAEPNYLRKAMRAPIDPRFHLQWGLHNTGQPLTGTFPPLSAAVGADIDAPEAWNTVTAAEDVVIAVIDSGVDYQHPDLGGDLLDADSGNIWTHPGEDDLDSTDDDGNGFVDDLRGWNFVGTQFCSIDDAGACHCAEDDPDGSNDPMDDFGHGTAVAGIIGAIGDNQEGIAGVIWRAKIMPLKVLGSAGCGSVADEVQAIEYAIQQGARIVVIASGGAESSAAERAAIQAAQDAGILVIAPAGNDASNNDEHPVYPASYGLANVTSVAASDFDDRLAFFSNYGRSSVDLAAPGDCVLSTMPMGSFGLEQRTSFQCTSDKLRREYDYSAGSSFAAAHVAGAAGLLLAQDSSLTTDELKAILLGTADPNASLKDRTVSGGRLNLHRALKRDFGSTFTGGTGGGGGCSMAAPAEEHPVSLGAAVSLILSLMLPGLLRARGVRRFASTRLFIGLIVLLCSGQISHAQQPEQPTLGTELANPHSLSLKLGLHAYSSSDYFDANDVYFDDSDLTGAAAELEYNYEYHVRSRFALAVGHYDGEDRFAAICCGRVEFSTSYALATVKFDFEFNFGKLQPLRLYLGPGIGLYWFRRTVEVLDQTDRFSAKPYGLHFVVGLDAPIGRRVNVLIETRYASATIDSADELDDRLDVGGITAFLGLTWNFAGSVAAQADEAG